MREFFLSSRLAALAEQVPRDTTFADIGTDHALLPIRLLRRGVITRAIAADLREGPLQRARETARRHGLEAQISFRLGDGLSVLRPGEADTIAIAGMGGGTIAGILGAASWARTEGTLLLLQPMSAVRELRVWLQQNGFTVERETLCADGKWRYVCLAARGGQAPPLTPGEVWAGRQWRGMEAPLRADYLEDALARATRALEGIQKSRKEEDTPHREALAAAAAELMRMREEWMIWQR